MIVVLYFLKEIGGEANKKLYQIGELKKYHPSFCLKSFMKLFEKCNYAGIFYKDFFWIGKETLWAKNTACFGCQANLMNTFHGGKFKPKSTPMDLIHTPNFVSWVCIFNEFALFGI